MFFFATTGCIFNYTESKADDLVKPQGVSRKIAVPDYYVSDEETVEHASSSDVITPEEA